jgi:hypothetical protein
MELRHHPLLTYHGIPSWPPVWSPARPREGKQVLKGEIGVLMYMLPNSRAEKCYRVIEHEHVPYVGCLFCSDAKFYTQLAAILQNQCGRTIKEIGDLDLSFAL